MSGDSHGQSDLPVDHAQAASAQPESAVDSAVQSLTAERDDLKDQLLRTRAEMDNFRKRLNRERDDERRYAALPVVRDLLPALDNLHRASAVARTNPEQAASLVQGVDMVLKQVDEILSRFGAERIISVGQPFDPHFHEALQQVPTSEYPPMTVVQELERGFKLHDRVIRPSKVIVSKAE